MSYQMCGLWLWTVAQRLLLCSHSRLQLWMLLLCLLMLSCTLALWMLLRQLLQCLSWYDLQIVYLLTFFLLNIVKILRQLLLNVVKVLQGLGFQAVDPFTFLSHATNSVKALKAI